MRTSFIKYKKEKIRLKKFKTIDELKSEIRDKITKQEKEQTFTDISDCGSYISISFVKGDN